MSLLLDFSQLIKANWIPTVEPTRDGLDGLEWTHYLKPNLASIALDQLRQLHPNVPKDYRVIAYDEPKYFLQDPSGAIVYIDAETEQWLLLGESLSEVDCHRRFLYSPSDPDQSYSFYQLHHRLAYCPTEDLPDWFDRLREKEAPNISLILLTELVQSPGRSETHLHLIHEEYSFLTDFFASQLTPEVQQAFLSAWQVVQKRQDPL